MAEAVGASAAYPLLVDPYLFRTRWEDLRADLLDQNRWQRPAGRSATDFSRWRRRFGRPSGQVTFPLVDGGVYDNEGLNGLRGAGITHAILSNASPIEGDLSGKSTFHVLAQTVEVMHARLGATTRQLAHEITHGMHPGEARLLLQRVAADLRRTARENPPIGDRLNTLAEQVESTSVVGWPPRQHQFAATAQVLLHSDDIARNVSASYEEAALDVPREARGLHEDLVADVACVRTDLDALEPFVFDVLVAQGYFVADAYLKIGVPDVVRECSPEHRSTLAELRAAWGWAHGIIASANAHPENTATLLRQAGRRRKLWGRSESITLRLRFGVFFAVGVFVNLVLLLLACWAMRRLAIWLWSAL